MWMSGHMTALPCAPLDPFFWSHHCFIDMLVEVGWCQIYGWCGTSMGARSNRARQLYNNISMLFLFPVKNGKLSSGVNTTFNASCYG